MSQYDRTFYHIETLYNYTLTGFSSCSALDLDAAGSTCTGEILLGAPSVLDFMLTLQPWSHVDLGLDEYSLPAL